MAWADNKNTILGKVSDGTASAAEQAWYNTWVEAGKPETQAELQAWKATNSGVEADKGYATYWNPEKGLYQTDPYNPETNYKPGDDYGYYINNQGEYVYGLQPEDSFKFYDSASNGYDLVQGTNPNPSTPAPSQGGMAPGGGQYYGDPNDPNNTGNLVDQPWYEPPIEVDPWNPPEGGGYDPSRPPYDQRDDYVID